MMRDATEYKIQLMLQSCYWVGFFKLRPTKREIPVLPLTVTNLAFQS